MNTGKDKAKTPKRAAGAKRKSPAKAPGAKKKATAPARKAAAKGATAREPAARKTKAVPARGRPRRKAPAKAPVRAAEAATDVALREAAGGDAEHGVAPAPIDDDAASGAETVDPLGGQRESLIERSFTPFALRHEPRAAASEPREGDESEQRQNKLVPTNAVHTTKRRLKRASWHNRAIAVVALGMLAGLVIMTDRSVPTEISPFERPNAPFVPSAGPDRGQEPAMPDPSRLQRKLAGGETVIPAPPASDPVQAAPDRTPERAGAARPTPPRRRQLASAAEATDAPVGGESQPPAVPETAYAPLTAPADAGGLSPLELVEMERILGRLDLGASEPDGVLDPATERAIRAYQEIAGLPVDGEPSRVLLHDMREVAKILDAGG